MFGYLWMTTVYLGSFLLFYRWTKRSVKEAYQKGKDVGYNLGYQEGQLKLIKALSGRKVSDIEFLKSIGITL